MGRESPSGINVVTETSLVRFFSERLEQLDVRDDTRAYVVSVLTSMRQTGAHDLSQSSLVLTYFDAVQVGSFETFQRIGDWTLFVCIIIPESIKEPELTFTLGKQSYQQCHRMLRGQWALYEELSLRLEEVGRNACELLRT